jgi:hypothetical protein
MTEILASASHVVSFASFTPQSPVGERAQTPKSRPLRCGEMAQLSVHIHHFFVPPVDFVAISGQIHRFMISIVAHYVRFNTDSDVSVSTAGSLGTSQGDG